MRFLLLIVLLTGAPVLAQEDATLIEQNIKATFQRVKSSPIRQCDAFLNGFYDDGIWNEPGHVTMSRTVSQMKDSPSKVRSSEIIKSISNFCETLVGV